MNTAKLTILQVPLDSLSSDELKAKIDYFLAGSTPRQIVTVNPEFLLESRSNEPFRQVLLKADLSLADGFGLQIAGLVKGCYLARHTGADLSKYLFALAAKEQHRVAIINWTHSLSSSEEITKVLEKLYPKLVFKIIKAERGEAFLDLSTLLEFQADIILSTLGAPFQDQLLAELLPQTAIKLGVGIGGSLDYLTGKAERAPLLFRKLGFEWLWRLAINPQARWQRIFAAVCKFPFYFILDDLIHPFLYRPNVVGFIYRDNEVLIVNSAKENRDFWKLPQGGVEAGENLASAIEREMYEELKLKNYQITKIYPRLFRYRWPSGYSIRGYKGQSQSLCLLSYKGAKDGITLDYENRDYKWVPIEELTKQVDPVFEKAYTLFVDKYRQSQK